MFQWIKDRQRIQQIALENSDQATVEQQLQAVQQMCRFLPANGAFKFLENLAQNSRHDTVRAKTLEILLLSGTSCGIQAVLRHLTLSRENLPAWSHWRDFGIPVQLRCLSGAVPALECQGQLILKQMGKDGYAALEKDAEDLRATLGLIRDERSKAAEQRFMSSVSWHKKHSVRPVAPKPAPTPAATASHAQAPTPAPAPRPEPQPSLQETQDQSMAEEIKRLLLSASFHYSRNRRAFDNLSKQLNKMGDSIRAGGPEHWARIKARVRIISGSHFVGLEQYYELLGDAPHTSSAESSSAERHATQTAPVAPATSAIVETNWEILYGRRTIRRLGDAPQQAGDLPRFPAPDVASLATLPELQTKCVFKCCHVITGHPKPTPDVIQAWAAALGSELTSALSGTPARQILTPIPETGELVLYVFWDDVVTRDQVERVAVAMQSFLVGD